MSSAVEHERLVKESEDKEFINEVLSLLLSKTVKTVYGYEFDIRTEHNKVSIVAIPIGF